MRRTSRQTQGVETIADEVGGHAGGQVANIVASKHGCSTSRGLMSRAAARCRARCCSVEPPRRRSDSFTVSMGNGERATIASVRWCLAWLLLASCMIDGLNAAGKLCTENAPCPDPFRCIAGSVTPGSG